ncbi:MAG TPA: hypothetical protein VNZ26_30090, partial [Vicinamibacterales bacterium]|nr:hypothetical protein [Vicinamibacterales bacterium]
MAKPADPVDIVKLPGLSTRFVGFLTERYPFVARDAADAFEGVLDGRSPSSEAAIDALREPFRRELERRIESRGLPDHAETTPGVKTDERLASARAELLEACDGFLRRAAIEASLTAAERVEILRGMVLTRATDNRL